MKQLFTIWTIAVTQNTSNCLIFYLKVYDFHHVWLNELFTRTLIETQALTTYLSEKTDYSLTGNIIRKRNI